MTSVNKYRVVIDTNILISAIIVSGSTPDKLLKLWKDDRYSLIISEDLAQEVMDVCARPKFRNTYKLFSEKAVELNDNLKLSAELVIPILEKELPIYSRDPKDDKLLACALGGRATHLITGDKDLLVLSGESKFNNLKICTAKEFLDLLIG